METGSFAEFQIFSSAISENHRDEGNVVHIAFGGTEYDPTWLTTSEE